MAPSVSTGGAFLFYWQLLPVWLDCRCMNAPLLEDKIEQFIANLLKQERYSDEDERSIFPDGSDVCVCTSSARLVAKEFGGKVWGYTSWDNPTAKAGKGHDGHDFAIAGSWLVDYWAMHVEEITPKAVFHLRRDAKLISKFYGNRTTWKKVPL